MKESSKAISTAVDKAKANGVVTRAEAVDDRKSINLTTIVAVRSSWWAAGLPTAAALVWFLINQMIGPIKENQTRFENTLSRQDSKIDAVLGAPRDFPQPPPKGEQVPCSRDPDLLRATSVVGRSMWARVARARGVRRRLLVRDQVRAPMVTIINRQNADGVKDVLQQLLDIWLIEGTHDIEIPAIGGYRFGPIDEAQQEELFRQKMTRASTLRQTPHGRRCGLDAYPVGFNPHRSFDDPSNAGMLDMSPALGRLRRSPRGRTGHPAAAGTSPASVSGATSPHVVS